MSHEELELTKIAAILYAGLQLVAAANPRHGGTGGDAIEEAADLALELAEVVRKKRANNSHN